MEAMEAVLWRCRTAHHSVEAAAARRAAAAGCQVALKDCQKLAAGAAGVAGGMAVEAETPARGPQGGTPSGGRR
jgi:hypothetical protein